MEYDQKALYNEELFKRWRDARDSWDSQARKDLDFYLGNHFTSDESDELQSRNQADIPMDRISPAVEKLKSFMTARPPVFTAMPREDSDAKMAKVWQTILGAIWEGSDGDSQVKQAIHDFSTVGIGYLYVYVDAEADMGRGDVRFVHINPFRVYVPPSSRDRWFGDADGIILSTILTGEQLVNLYPELGATIDKETGEELDSILNEISTYSDEDFPNTQNKLSRDVYTPSETKDYDYYRENKYQVLERFYKKKVTFYRLIDNQTGAESILNEEEFLIISDERASDFERNLLSYEAFIQTRVAVIVTCGEIVLDEYLLNIKDYPIVCFPNNWTETPYPRSDVSRALPMQRLLNKLWSLALSHAQASAGLKLLVPVGSAVNGLDQLERDWANPNAVIEVDSSQGEPHYPSPTPLAGEFYRLIQQCEFYIDFIFGIPEIMHGMADKAPETFKGTQQMIALGSERSKSKLRDVEHSIIKLGRVIYAMSKQQYTYRKYFRTASPNNDLTEVTINMYDDVTQTIIDIQKDKNNIEQHDIRIVPGSTLPTSKYAELNVYLEAYQLGIVDKLEVLKKNPEIFDKEGVMQRSGEIQQLQAINAQLQQQLKELQGDLQTARRESVADRKRVEVQKFKSKLGSVAADAKADKRISANELTTKVRLESERLQNAIARQQDAMLGSIDSPVPNDEETS
tara:strand:- start:6518 stop:8572 length:2055 start_codon:yes stop_codon:yes gene_type:complete